MQMERQTLQDIFRIVLRSKSFSQHSLELQRAVAEKSKF